MAEGRCGMVDGGCTVHGYNVNKLKQTLGGRENESSGRGGARVLNDWQGGQPWGAPASSCRNMRLLFRDWYFFAGAFGAGKKWGGPKIVEDGTLRACGVKSWHPRRYPPLNALTAAGGRDLLKAPLPPAAAVGGVTAGSGEGGRRYPAEFHGGNETAEFRFKNCHSARRYPL
jgi:hypothetical protein